VTITLIVSISFLSTETFAQNNLKIFDVPGGGSGSTSQTEDSNDNTAIYVIGGLVIAGILVYALVFKKDKKSDTDTTASLNSGQLFSGVNAYNSVEDEIRNVKEALPIDFYMGIKNNDAIMNERTYQLGVRVKL
jgi:hypothetical protein